MPRPRKTTAAPPETTALIYARVSTKEQAEEGYSIEAQLALLRAYCLRHGLAVADEFVEKESAHSKGRPVFLRMLAAAKREKVKAIVVEKTDRLYRNIADWVRIDELGVEIHLVKENEVLNEDSRSHQKFVHGIKVLVAKNYSDNLGEEASKGMREKAKQGWWPSVAPVGYLNVEREKLRLIEPDAKTAPLVRALFEAYASGDFGLKRAGAYAATLGLTARSGGRLPASQVQAILRNPVYRGVVRWDGEEYPGRHAPLVSASTWERCQEIMEGRNGSLGGGPAKPEFEYRGLVRCGVCGCAASPYSSKGHVYYACTGARGCRRQGIREEALTEAIALALDGARIRQSVIDLVRDGIRDGHAEIVAKRDAERNALEANRAALEAKLERLYGDRVAGEVPESAYRRFKSEWEAELAECERQVAAQGPARRKTWEESLQMLEALSNAGARFRELKPEGRRAFVKAGVSNLKVVEGKVEVDLQPWFKMVLDANRKLGLNVALEGQLENWLPAMDSNHD